MAATLRAVAGIAAAAALSSRVRHSSRPPPLRALDSNDDSSAYRRPPFATASAQTPTLPPPSWRTPSSSSSSPAPRPWPVQWWGSVRLLARAAWLAVVFAPIPPLLFAAAALGRRFPAVRSAAHAALRAALICAGPAFIKLGQWAASRPDMFAPDLCAALARLQRDAPPHSVEASRDALAAAFGDDIATHWVVDPVPVGSGCVAQVHRAWSPAVAANAANALPVAIKIMHPGVVEDILRDIALMRMAAGIIHRLPSGRFLGTVDAVTQFSRAMVEQLDLTIEARHLDRFRANFADNPRVTFPAPVWPYVTRTVLVESFEPGVNVSAFFPPDPQSPNGSRPPPSTTSGDHEAADVQEEARARLAPLIARTGLDAFLQMMVLDNFVHADLHPGNVLVRPLPRKRSGRFAYAQQQQSSSFDDAADVQLVFLDAGLVCELNARDRVNFRDLFLSVVKGDGLRAGQLMVERSGTEESPQTIKFTEHVRALVDRVRASSFRLDRLSVGAILGRMLSLVREYQVPMDGNFATLAVALGIVEGLGRRLDPELDLLRRALQWFAPNARAILWQAYTSSNQLSST
jgi:aarF domain-containing kinase